MKSSIAISLIVIAGIFGFVSGYSIGKKNATVVQVVASAPASGEKTETKAATGGYGAPAAPAEKPAAAAGGYGK